MTHATHFVRINFLKTIVRKILQQILAVALMIGLQINVSMAQGLNSPALQKEAQSAASKSAPQQGPVVTAPSVQTQQTVSPQAGSMLVLPAGTKLPLGLLRPLSVKNARPGENVYLQITFPVTAGSQMVIPPGAYVQGVIDKIVRRDRARAVLEFEMRSVSLIFSSGYTVNFTGTLDTIPNSAEQRTPDMRNPHDIPASAAMGATGGITSPSLPAPSLGNGPRNAMIGLGVAAAVGTTLLFVAASHGDIEMAAGTPLEITLPAPLELDRNRVAAAVQQYSAQMASAPPEIVKPPEKPKICYESGSPGTPDTVIPGSPGTPATVIPGVNGAPDTVIPGTPATPDTVIPGTPGTPGREYPCPK